MRRIIFWITTLVVSLMIVMMAPVGPSSFISVQTVGAQQTDPQFCKTGPLNAITDVPGVKVGHYTDAAKYTGATAIIIEDGAVPGVEVRGGCPGTLDLDLIKPGTCGDYIHGVSLSCGSCYGYASEVGVREFLKEKGLGLPSGPGIVVPLVPGAICYDLGGCGTDYMSISGLDRIRYGYEAAKAAKTGPVEQGRVGAGMGSSWSLGTASIDLGYGAYVGCIVVHNTGSAYNSQTCELWARNLEIKDPQGNWEFSKYGLKDAPGRSGSLGAAMGLSSNLLAKNEPLDQNNLEEEEVTHPHTAIGVCATNVQMDKAQAKRMAIIAMGGDQKAIRPGAGTFDGDTLIAISVGNQIKLSDLWGGDRYWGTSSANLSRLSMFAADCYARAFMNAVLNDQGRKKPDGSVCSTTYKQRCPQAYINP